MNDFNDKKELLCNVTLIKALKQFFPTSGKLAKTVIHLNGENCVHRRDSSLLIYVLAYYNHKKIQEWLEKIQEIEDGMSDYEIRNEYAFYLLINMQNGILSQPFNKCPPSGKLKPLCRILPDFIYEDVQKQLKVNYCRLNKLLTGNTSSYEMPNLKCEPSVFHCEQPRPRKGVTASFAVFSNYDDEENN